MVVRGNHRQTDTVDSDAGAKRQILGNDGLLNVIYLKESNFCRRSK